MDEVLEAAARAREKAYAPYSKFLVGAAIRSSDGRIYTGSNIESASYGLTVCAERVAVWKAISEGARSFVHAAVVTDVNRPAPPCGACRQVLWELCGDIEIVLANLTGRREIMRLSDLIPSPFDASYL